MFRHIPQSELQEAIAQLKNTQQLYATIQDCIISSPAVQAPGTPNFYIFKMDKKNEVGSGAWGIVYRAYKLTRDGTYVTEGGKPKLFAVKVLQNASAYKPEEAEIQKKYLSTELPFTYNDKILIFSEYIPGAELVTDDHQANPVLQHATLSQLLTAAVQLIGAIQLMHNHTPSTGNAIAHFDIKGSNIKIEIDGQNVSCIPFDFGFSTEVKGSETLALGNYRGSMYYRAPEIILRQEGSPKSDIYSLVPVLAAMFGVVTPYLDKAETLNQLHRYHYRGIFARLKMPIEFSAIIPHVVSFLDRMQSLDPAHRPDIDEVLIFFNSLKQLNHFCMTSSHALQNTAIAKLILLASGLWNTPIGIKKTTIFESRNTPQSTEEAAPRTFKDFDFANEPEVCAQIAAHGKITLKQALDILSSSVTSESKEEKKSTPSTSTPPSTTAVTTPLLKTLLSESKLAMFKKPDTPLAITEKVIVLLMRRATTLAEGEQELVLAIAGIASLIANKTSVEIAEKIIRITHVLIIDSQKNSKNILDGLIKSCSRGKLKNGRIYKLIEEAVKLDEKKSKTIVVSESKEIATVSSKQINHLETLIGIVSKIKENKKKSASNGPSVKF